MEVLSKVISLNLRRVGTQMLYTEAFVRLPMILKTPVVANIIVGVKEEHGRAYYSAETAGERITASND